MSFTVVKSFDAIKYNWIFHKLQILYILLDIVHVYESRMKATMSHELKFQRDKKGLYSWDTN